MTIQVPEGKTQLTLPNGMTIQIPKGATQVNIPDKVFNSEVKETAPPAPFTTQDGKLVETQLNLPQEQDYTLEEKVGGVGETLLSLGTGATAGAAGQILGTLKGGYDRLVSLIENGDENALEEAKKMQKTAEEYAQMFTYEPTTEAGQEYTQAVGEALEPTQAIAPLAPQIEQFARMGKMPQVRQRSSDALKQDIATVEQVGIKPMTSDIVQPKTFIGKFAQSGGEKIPFAGTGGKRVTQMEQRTQAVKDTLRDFGAVEASEATNDVMQSLLKKRGGDISKYATIKKDIFNKLDDVGEVPVNKTVNTIDGEIAKLKGLKTQSVEPAIQLLDDFKQSLQNQNINNVEILRKQLGEQLSSPDLASVKSTADKSVNNIYKSLNEDIGNFIKENGDKRDYTKWQVSNKRLSNLTGELKNNTLKNTLAKGDATPELVERLLFSQKPSEIKLLYKNLTPQGRERAKVAILNNVLQKSGGIDELSTAKFVSNLDKQSKPLGIFFKGKDKKKIDGLVKALKITKRSEEAGVSTPTGQQAVPIVGAAALTDIFGGFGAGLGTGVTIGGIARLYESRPITNLLLKLADAPKAKELPIAQQLFFEIQNLQQEEK